ncbi:aldolase/citrate lyase family protein [uncultured Methanoregula sp.]|uniref:aldolase/citrate lyase family protein n=1 Tax=uncultured Methanoregula sp. TaxID=1005933 RepID=UPI002AAB8A3D|nr:aldolase/citrate lyase family protein [uncultured Methanoregula sp.]
MILKELEKKLYAHLTILRDKYGCEGIKSEFENEGSDYRDLILLRYLTAKTGLKMFIKIGGVEAFSDLKLALHLNADGIIVPMVESEFALIKSQNMIEDLLGTNCEDFDVYINIESKTAVEHLDAILSTMNSTMKGITIGRSDLSYSYGRKSQQDSDFINHEVEKIVDMAKAHGVTKITVGGGISKQTFNNQYFINTIAPKLSCIETRNVILGAKSIQNPDSLMYALDFEREYLNYKLGKNHLFLKADEARFDTLMSRG